MLFTKSLPVVTLLAANAEAWGTTIHNQIGFMAEEYLTPRTAQILGHILEPKYKGSIGRAAAWPDSYSHTDEGEYTAQWHYIDPADNVGFMTFLCPRK